MIFFVLLSCMQTPDPPTLPLMFDGCVAVTTGPRCLPGSTPVRLWVEALPPLSVMVDGQPVGAMSQIEGGGVLLDVAVPSGAETLVIEDNNGRIGRLLLGKTTGTTDTRQQVLAGLSEVDAAIADGDVGTAEAHLQRITDRLPGDLTSAWQLQLRRGDLAGYRGDHRAAMRHYRHANQLSGRMIYSVNTPVSLRLAEQLAAVGRHREARRILRSEDGCAAEESRGWVLVEAAELSGVEIELSGVIDCPSISRTHLTQARDALEFGDLDALESALNSAAPERHDETLWAAYLRGRLHQHRGQLGEALSAMEGVIASTGAASPRHRWQALVAQGEILASLGQHAEAIAVLKEARAVLLEHSLLVPLHNGRDRFLSRGLPADRLLVTLLLADDRPEDALVVIRTARLLLLQGLLTERFSVEDRERWLSAARDYRVAREAVTPGDWSATSEQNRVLTILRRRQEELARQALDAGTPHILPEASLRSPDPGELLLTWFSLGSDWVGIAASSEGLTTARIPSVDLNAPPEILAEALLVPFAEQIASAEVITLLPHGTLRRIDLHMLPLQGRPLLAHHLVRYSLDLPPRPPRPIENTAAVVSDPRLNLPGARAEAALVTGALTRAGRVVRPLSGSDVTRRSLLLLLEDTAMLHYAGHGERENIVTDSAFLVNGGGRLTVGDLLTLSRAPQTVVLSTCDGAASPPVAVESLGLAQAFLLAGGEAVIAATIPVDDADSRALMERLYADPADPVGSWRAAVLAEDMGMFRLMVP
ncbi:MAG: hypothetical protein ACI8RZ_000190 [Myxococcota bacterium]|jgi:hypothetical protein